MFAIRGHHGRQSEGTMIEAAGTQSLVGALPVHSLSCNPVDDVTRLREVSEGRHATARVGEVNETKAAKKEKTKHCSHSVQARERTEDGLEGNRGENGGRTGRKR